MRRMSVTAISAAAARAAPLSVAALALALAATLSAAGARPAAAAPDAAPPADAAAGPAAPASVSCINRRDIRDLRLSDKRTLMVRMNSSPDYVNRLDADCRFREGSDVWVFRSPTGLICAGETLDISTRGIGRTGFCKLGRWEPQPRATTAGRR